MPVAKEQGSCQRARPRHLQPLRGAQANKSHLAHSSASSAASDETNREVHAREGSDKDIKRFKCGGIELTFTFLKVKLQ